MVELSRPKADLHTAGGFFSLLHHLESGAQGLGALQRLVELSLAATSASGAAFLEYHNDKARVVAASGILDWFRGQSITDGDIGVEWRLGPRVRVFDRFELGPEVQRRLSAQGIRRVLRAISVIGEKNIGSFVFCYVEGSPLPTSDQYSAAGLLASCAAGLYPCGRNFFSEEKAKTEKRLDSAYDHNLFVAVTSHELRTPVTVIRGYADTLNEHWDRLDENTRRSAIKTIGKRAKDLSRLLDRLLSAAGDSICTDDLVTEVCFDVVDAVRYALTELSSDLHHYLRLSLPDNLPKVYGDRSAIATIVTELVTNACKYSKDLVDVELAAGTDSVAVWIRVSDRGIGIPQEYTERAFEKFWQLETEGQRQRSGVGLGLYLVRRVVERHKGWVSLRPRYGGGTIAEVRLPRADITSEDT